MIEPLGDLRRGHHPRSRRSEFDRQRDPIEPHTDLADRAQLTVIEHRAGLGRAVDEQLDGLGPFRQRRHGPHPLRRDAQRFAARGQYPHPRCPRRHLLDNARHHAQDVFTVVEDHQQLLGPQPAHQRDRQRLTGLRRDPQHLRDRPQHHVVMGERRQVDQPHPVRVVRQHVRADLDREAGLADAADAGQRHQTMLTQQPPHLDDLAVATHERRQLQRQIRRCRRQRPQRRKLAAADLPHPLRPRQIAEAMLSQITKIPAITHQRRGRLRGHDLPAVRDTHQPGATVQRRPEVVPVAQLGFAGVQPHPHRQHILQTGLRVDHRVHRVRRGREHRGYPVAGVLEQMPLVLVDHVPQDRVVLHQQRPHRFGFVLPQPRRTLNIGEQERHGAGRRALHPASLPRPPGARSRPDVAGARSRPRPTAEPHQRDPAERRSGTSPSSRRRWPCSTSPIQRHTTRSANDRAVVLGGDQHRVTRHGVMCVCSSLASVHTMRKPIHNIGRGEGVSCLRRM